MIRGLEPGRRVALIISECQRGVIEAQRSDFPGLVEQVAARGIVTRTAALAEAFRAGGHPVLHVHVAHRPDYADLPITNLIMARSKKKGGMIVGTEDAQAVVGLEPHPGDILHSRGYSLIAFHGTDLDARLRNMGIQTLVFSGVSTNVAISGMAECASDLGYQAIVAEDCIAGASAQSHDFIVRNLLPLYSTVTYSRRIIEALRAGSGQEGASATAGAQADAGRAIRGLEPERGVALLINEMQRGTIDPDLSEFPDLVAQIQERKIVPKIAALADRFRAAGLPVIHLHISHQPDYADLPVTNLLLARSKKNGRRKLGSVDAEPGAGLEPAPSDIVHVRGYSLVAFHGTDLDTRLRNMGINTLVMTGVSSNVAIPGLAVCASDLGYQAIVAEDCIAGASVESHDFMVGNLLPLYATIADSGKIADAIAARARGQS